MDAFFSNWVLVIVYLLKFLWDVKVWIVMLGFAFWYLSLNLRIKYDLNELTMQIARIEQALERDNIGIWGPDSMRIKSDN